MKKPTRLQLRAQMRRQLWLKGRTRRAMSRSSKEWADKNSEGQKRRWAATPAVELVCIHCGKQFLTKGRMQRKTCSRECQYAASKSDPIASKAITLAGSIRLGRNKGEIMRRLISEAIDKPCRYCSKIVTLENASVDHMTPMKGLHRAAGFLRATMDREENLQIICRKCNLAKGDVTDAAFRRLLAFLRSDAELYDPIMRRLGMSGAAWKAIKERHHS